MSRTVDLITRGVRTRNSPGGFNLLNPTNIRRAVNIGRTAANIAREGYQSLSDLIRSPRISAGAQRFTRSRPNNMARNRNRFNRRKMRGLRSRRRRGRRSRTKGNKLAKRIKRTAKRGVRSLMKRALNDSNYRIVYDYAVMPTVDANAIEIQADPPIKPNTQLYYGNLSDFPKLKSLLTLVPENENDVRFREYKFLKAWYKFKPMKAHKLRHENAHFEMYTGEPLHTHIVPHNHIIPTAAYVPWKILKNYPGVKLINPFKKSATIIPVVPFVEEIHRIANGTSAQNVNSPMARNFWIEYDGAAAANEPRFFPLTAQVPIQYVHTTGGTSTITVRYEVELHVICAVRGNVNDPFEDAVPVP